MLMHGRKNLYYTFIRFWPIYSQDPKKQLYNDYRLKVQTLIFNLRGKVKELQLFNTPYCLKYWHPLLMNMFDYFSNFYEYKS